MVRKRSFESSIGFRALQALMARTASAELRQVRSREQRYAENWAPDWAKASVGACQMRAPILFSSICAFFSDAAIAGRLSALWSVGILVAAVGCTSASSEVATVAQAVGTPPVSRVSCSSNAPCTMPLIAAGENHTVVLKSDGTVWTWGSNSKGQLGDGTTQGQRSTPWQVSKVSDVVAVAAGWDHTVALDSNGSVWTWGWNKYGQLGNDSTTDLGTPVRVSNLSNVVAVAAGHYHTVALKSDGTVWTWGGNGNGQLGNGSKTDRSMPEQVPSLSHITAVAAGGSHTVALESDGTVWSWGSNDFGQLGYDSAPEPAGTPAKVQGLSGVVPVTAVAAGQDHTVALTSDGTVWTWGGNSHGQLGNGSTTKSSNSVPVPAQVQSLPGVFLAVAAGEAHTVVLKSDGTVWTWGWNQYGQLGDGSDSAQTSPWQIQSFSGLLAVAAGGSHTVALKSDGTVWAWGWNQYGQLGDGTTTNQNRPVKSKFSYQADSCAVVPSCSEGACIAPVCSGHGTCSSGACTCNAGFGGASCDECAPDYLDYPNCVQPPDAGIPDEPDAGPDAGPDVGSDSAPDAGPDSGPHDAASPGSDAASQPDSGDSIYDLGGCGCQHAAAPSALGALALLVAAFGPRRQRSR